MRSQSIRPRRGLSLRESTSLRPGVYRFSVGEEEPVITVRAEDACIDCTGVVLRGPDGSDGEPRGVALRVLNSRNVEIVGLETVGFQVGVHVLHSSSVTLRNVRAHQTRSKAIREETPEDPDNWVDLYDKSNWRVYGSGIWMERCEGGVIADCVATHAQNGITLDKTDNALIIGNTCTDNAGWGIHLDRALKCRIIGNDCSRCRRPGADVLAAGIAINNGCHENEVVSNLLRDCSHGLLLTAEYNEQSNRNLIASNDAGGSQLTGIRCLFVDDTRLIHNRVRGAQFGLWLGHSRRCEVRGHEIGEATRAGIVIDHGLQVALTENLIEQSSVGIRIGRSLSAGRPPTDCVLTRNSLVRNQSAIKLECGWRTRILENVDDRNETFLLCGEECIGTEIH